MHCVSGVQTKVEKGSPGVALTCSKWATPSLWGWKGQGQEQRTGRQSKKFFLTLYCSEELCSEESVLLISSLGLWSKAFFCARECNYWFSKKKKKKCSFQRIQIALISRKIHTAALGLFKRHRDESVSGASTIFSFILISSALNVFLFLKKKKAGGKGMAGSRFEFQVTT